LRLERCFETCEQVIERVAELLELVIGSREREPLVQVGGRDRPCRRGDPSQRAQHSAGGEPPEQGGTQRSPGEHDRGRLQYVTEVGVMLGVQQRMAWRARDRDWRVVRREQVGDREPERA
jgi:hypothetical protein